MSTLVTLSFFSLLDEFRYLVSDQTVEKLFQKSPEKVEDLI